MDFSLSPEIEALRAKTREFIAAEVLPLEDDPANYEAHQNIREDVLECVRGKAKAAGLWAPQAPKERGGMGLPVVGWAALYEEANRSIFGPAVLNCAAPDDGNINLLSRVATESQKDRWLQPVIDGKVRSAFAMTEPHPGSGSDPTMMLTSAERTSGGWRISGRKWFITGAEAAQHGVVCGRGRNPALRLWPTIFSGEIDVFPSKRRDMGQHIGR